jgi:hypothetical protein
MRPQPLIMGMIGDIVCGCGQGPDGQARRIGFGTVPTGKIVGCEILGQHAADMGITRAREGGRDIGPLPLPGAIEKGGVAGSGFPADQTHHQVSRLCRQRSLKSFVGKVEMDLFRCISIPPLHLNGNP